MMEGTNLKKLLYGEYEYNNFSNDYLKKNKVPDFPYNHEYTRGRIYSPYIDKFHLQSDGERPRWPDNSDFAVCLTHDVDHVSAYSSRHSVRRSLLRAYTRATSKSTKNRYISELGISSSMKSIVGGILSGTKNLFQYSNDPYHSFERWLDIESEVDAKSTFFILPEKTNRSHISDSEYRYTDTIEFDGESCTVAEMVSSIDGRGWEIGLHPSWFSYDDASELSRQKEQLESIINGEIKSVRQHYLHYNPRKTPQAQDTAGFKYDSTLGFNRNIGFRRGTSYPWYAYNISQNQPLDLLEIPMIVQDTALFRQKGLNLDVDTAFNYITMLADEIKATGGVLTLSWHPHNIDKQEWVELYKKTLKYLDEQGAWFGSIAEIGDWWRVNGPEIEL